MNTHKPKNQKSMGKHSVFFLNVNVEKKILAMFRLHPFLIVFRFGIIIIVSMANDCLILFSWSIVVVSIFFFYKKQYVKVSYQ